MSGEERILDRFEGARRLRDDEWMVLCPAHGDRNPSLHVTHREGRWLLYCHAGCELEDVLARAGLEQRDLFDERGMAIVKRRPSTATRTSGASRSSR